jgi:Protein of unknown function (DUF1579)
MAPARDESTASGQSGIGPGDVPTGRPEALSRLDALVGEWEMEFSFESGFFGPGSPAVSGRGGRTTFQWFDGEFFLIQRATAEDPSAPNGIMIIGMGKESETFEQHYYDSRGVTRVYQMSLNEGTWNLWREAPGFHQRYTGVFSEDGNRITGAWEKSADGSGWKHDFDLSYIKA